MNGFESAFTDLNFFYAWNLVTVMWKKKHLLQSHNLACHTADDLDDTVPIDYII